MRRAVKVVLKRVGVDREENVDLIDRKKIKEIP